MRCGKYKKALVYLNKAIADNSKDSRHATVHGMHFIPYFPHREKGIVLYHLEKYSDALQELTLSINQESSDRAIYYLEIVKKQIQLTNNAQTIPTITIDPLPDITRGEEICLSGKADDMNFISEITFVNDLLFPDSQVRFFIEQSQQTIPFSRKLFPGEGHYKVEIKAKNLLGKESTKQVSFQVDRSGPSISITSEPDDLTVCGILTDASPYIRWCVNNGPMQDISSSRAVFCVQPGKESVLQAWDQVGNSTQARLSVKANKTLLVQRSVEIMSDSDIYSKIPWKPPLVIDIESFPHQERVWYQQILIHGVLRSLVPVHSLMINNKKVVSSQQGKEIHFSQSMQLKSGKNLFIIQALNTDAQRIEKKLLCYRETPQALQYKNKYPIHMKKPLIIASDFKKQAKELIYLSYQQLVNSNRFIISGHPFEQEIKHTSRDKNTIIPQAHVEGFVEIESKTDNQLDVTIGMRFSKYFKTDHVLTFDAFISCSKDSLTASYPYLISRLHNKIKNYYKRCQATVLYAHGKQIIAEWQVYNGFPKMNLPFYILRPIPMYSAKTGCQLGNDWVIESTVFPKLIDYPKRQIVLNGTAFPGYRILNQ